MPVTETGLDELRQAIDQLPRQVQLRLRAVAFQSSRRIKENARSILLSKIHGHNTKHHQQTADSIVINELESGHLFQVRDENPDNPNLGLWLERGTIHMQARPFFRPARDAEDAHYRSEIMKAAVDVLDPLERL